MIEPRVSVVVPAYNQCEYLREALASALAQTMSDLEVIVVDDGSTDRTPEVCAAIGDPRLRYVRQANDATMGIGARNQAMLLARGEWIAPLDQDDRWAPEKLERQLAMADHRRNVGAVFCRVQFVNADGQTQGEQAPALPSGDVFHQLLSANRYYVSTGLFRRSLIPKMGLPHESVAIGDWYLWISVARHTEVAVVDEPLADYRVHDEGFQVAQRSADASRFWHDHWRFAQAIAPRLHPGCAACRQAVSMLRKQIADQQTEVVRAALQRGEFSRGVVDAIRRIWQAQPDGPALQARCRSTLRLARAALRGVWARARPR